MPASAANLLVGPGSVWSGAFGAVEPEDDAVTTALDTLAYTDHGATDGGVTVTASREYFRLRMDQTVESPGRRLTELDVVVKTSLAEPTLENWAAALADAATAVTVGGTGATGYASFDIGGPDEPGAEPTYRAVIFRGRAPKGRRRLVIVRKALSFDEVESEYKRDDQTFIPVSFGAHWVSTTLKSVHVVDERPGA